VAEDPLAVSLARGPHALLGALVGDWAGTTRTWFRPGELADESSTSGTVRAILGGRFVVQEYRGSIDGEELEGQATIGFDVARNRFVCVWVDSFHTGTAVMLSEGAPGVTDEISVLGHYDAAEGPPWGWRTSLGQSSPDALVVEQFNVPPGGEEYLAVETRYRRVG